MTDLNFIPELPDLDQHAWMVEGVCNDHDGNLWFAHPSQTAQINAAKRLCAGCPVRVQCLDYSLAFDGELEGIWAGLGQKSRRAARREMQGDAA